MSSIVHLPSHLLHHIQEFIVIIDHVGAKTVEYKKRTKNWGDFMNCTVRFQIPKREIIYLSLNTTYSRHYISDSTFRNNVLRSVRYPHLQIGLDLRGLEFDTASDEESVFLSHCTGLNFVDLSNTKVSQLTHLHHINQLCLDNCPMVSSVSSFEGVRVLFLSGSNNIASLLDLPTSVSALYLHDARILNLEDSMPRLKKIEEIYLSNNLSRIDFSLFQNLRKAHIYQCNNLSPANITQPSSCLKELNIERCNSVEVIHKFHDLEKLEISYCYNLHKIEDFQRINTLIIQRCESLQSIPFHSFKNIQSISLFHCDGLQEIRIDGEGLSVVKISQCAELKYIWIMTQLDQISVRKSRLVQLIEVEGFVSCLCLSRYGDWQPNIIDNGRVAETFFFNEK